MIDIGKLLRCGFELGRDLWKFSRKRERNQEDHFFPRHPDKLTPPLRPGQCMYCKRWYKKPYPRRGCLGRSATLLELP